MSAKVMCDEGENTFFRQHFAPFHSKYFKLQWNKRKGKEHD
jgi:hypothetical protein